MVHFSVRETYGTLAILALSLHLERGGGLEPLRVGSIARQQRLSTRFLEQVMVLLKKQGLVESVRGARGGYRLLKSPDRISLGEVLRAVSGEPTGALSKQQVEDGAEIVVIREIWKKLAVTVDNMSNAIHFQDLCAQVKEREKKGALMFHI